MRKILLAIACLAAFWLVLPAEAAVTLPNYAQGSNLSTTAQSKGKAVTDIVSLIVGILSIIGILVGAGYYAVGQGDRGKSWLFGGVIALLIAGSVYGIAALFV